MRLINPPFSVCEEILEYFKLYSTDTITEEKIISALAKTPSYVRKALSFLESCEIVKEDGNNIKLYGIFLIMATIGNSAKDIIAAGIANQGIYREFQRLKTSGKSNKQSAQYVITSHNLKITADQLSDIMESWTKYADIDNLVNVDDSSVRASLINRNSYITSNDREDVSVVDKIQYRGINSMFVDIERIEQLKSITNANFDLKKLIRKCEELNLAYSTDCFFSVGILTRSIIDHVPPIFEKANFADVAGSYGSKSFRDSMIHLEKTSRKIADSFLHTPVRRKEVLPTKTQINFSSDLDVLLGEIVRIL